MHLNKARILPSVAILLLLLVVSLAACTTAKPTSTPDATPILTPTSTATPVPTSTTAPAAMLQGEMLYQQTCAVCHGPDAEGTGFAPAIAGHSMSGLKAQVRNPMGKMTQFTPAMLTDGDLDEIAAYIASLGVAGAPMMEWEMAASEVMHYWMALLAIKNDDAPDARHHLADAVAVVNDPARVAEMREAMDLIDVGNMHDAEHEIEEMAGAESPSGITMQRFHLFLAQRAVEDGDAAGAEHHLEHFLGAATEEQKPVVMEALELVEKGDLHEAEHEVEELLEMTD